VLAEHRDERLHPFLKDFVVVAAKCIAGDPAPRCAVRRRLRRGGGVWISEGHHALRRRGGPPRVGAGVDAVRAPPGKPVHEAVPRPLEGSAFGLLERLGARDAGGDESELERAAFYIVGECHTVSIGK